jgi:hypothetical protein
MKSTHFTEMDSPLGTVSLCGTEQGLAGIFMQGHRHGPEDVHMLSSSHCGNRLRNAMDEARSRFRLFRIFSPTANYHRASFTHELELSLYAPESNVA